MQQQQNSNNCNLAKKNITYQNQLRLKIASKKTYSLVKSLKAFDPNLTIDYQKQEIVATEQEDLNPNLNQEGQKSHRSKLTLRQLLPISKASLLQNQKVTNSFSSLNAICNSDINNQNFQLFNKMNSSGGPGSNEMNQMNSMNSMKRRTTSVNSGRYQMANEYSANDLLSKSSDAAIHHKKIILSSITRNSGRKYLQEFKQVESSLSSYLKCENSRTRDDDLISSALLNKNQQKLFKKLAAASQTPTSQNMSPSNPSNMVNLSFSTVDPNSFKKIDK